MDRFCAEVEKRKKYKYTVAMKVSVDNESERIGWRMKRSGTGLIRRAIPPSDGRPVLKYNAANHTRDIKNEI